MKNIRVLFILVVGLITESRAASTADSLIIQFANRTRVVVYAPDKAGIKSLSAYDLNRIIREMSLSLDSLPAGKTAVTINEQDGQRYLKDTVIVVTKRNGDVRVVIRGSDETRTDTTGNGQNDSDNTDREYQRANRRRKGDWDFSFDGGGFGLTNFIQKSANPAYPEDSYDLRPLGSRYVSVALGVMPTISRGKRASLKLYYGLELAWNNFMFDGNNIVEKTPTGVAFPEAGRDLRKSKLTTCTIGIPVVPRVTFYNNQGRKVAHIGVGGYANYRIDSYRKIKEADGSKDRRHSNYDLNTYRYGLMTHLGIGKTDFFVKYDLSPLFKTGRGPDVRAISFGFGL